MSEEKLIGRFKRMFKCDTARISKPCGKLFLIIGWNRNTKQTGRHWYKNGRPIDFDYVEEKVVASGKTEAELLASAKEYKRLEGMDWLAYYDLTLGRDIVPRQPHEQVNR